MIENLLMIVICILYVYEIYSHIKDKKKLEEYKKKYGGN